MTVLDRLAQLSDSKRALLAKMMRAEPAREPIAVVGMGCRFPGGASDPESFWRLLREGRDTVTEVPRDRWDLERYFDPDQDAPGKVYTRWGSFLEGIDQFDAQLFGISQAEADAMDPQQRVLLEVSWEALEAAGYPPLGLAGSRTGVFMGLFQSAYAELRARQNNPALVNAASINGITHCMAVGRLSFLLGLQGPCVPVNTACSSSLVATHLACQALRAGECDLALAGGVNVMLSLEWLISFCRTGAMSPDGRCRTFDASANGTVEAEGCGVLVLKRLKDAQADGDRILALIRGSAVNHGGRSASLTAPSGLPLQAVIRRALTEAGASPADVGHLEAQGTGTQLGDSIEANAALAVLGQGRKPEDRLWLSSVKTNIGHAEAAAGAASLIKVILSLQHEAVPPHLHFRKLNPNIPLDRVPFAIPTKLEAWPRSGKPRLAGVNAFGASGTNAHLVLEEAPPAPARETRSARPRHLLCLSAQTEPGLRQLAERYRAHLASAGANGEQLSLGDLAFTANAGRSHLQERLAVTAGSAAELDARLNGYLRGAAGASAARARVGTGGRPKVAFLFSGEGSEYPGMGRRLYDAEPTFRRTLDACAEAVRGLTEYPLLDAMFGERVPDGLWTQAAYAWPLLYALQCALGEVWKSWGVVPDAVLGHGAGELAAAYAAGALPLEEGARQAARRGRLAQSMGEPAPPEPGPGASLAPGAPPAIPFFSSLTGGEVSNLGAHLTGHQGTPARFSDGLHALLQRCGAQALVEIGPQATLVALAAGAARDVAAVPSLLRGADDWEVLLSAAGALHARGVEVDFRAMDKPFGHRTAPAPTYPFQRKRYWLAQAGEARGPAGDSLFQKSIRTPRGEVYLEGELSGDLERPFLEHRLRGASVLPVAAALELLRAAAASATGDGRPALHQLRLEAPVHLGSGVQLQVWVGAESGGGRRLELHARAAGGAESAPWTKIASAELRRAEPSPAERPGPEAAGTTVALDAAACYALLGRGGLRCGPPFQLLQEVRANGRTASARIRGSSWAGPWGPSAASADACLQALAVLQRMLLEGGPDAGQAYQPVAAERIWMAPCAPGELRCVATLRGGAEGAEVVGDVRGMDASGRVVLEVEGLALRRSGPVAAGGEQQEAPGAASLRERLRQLPPMERLGALQRELRALMADALSLPALNEVGLSRPLAEAGVDSLRAAELRDALRRFFSRPFPTTLLFDHPTVEGLARHLASEDPDLSALIPEREAAPARRAPADLLEHLSQLSDEEAAALAAALAAGNE